MTAMDPIGSILDGAWRLYKGRGVVLTKIFAVPTVLLTLTALLFSRKTPQASLLGAVFEGIAVIVSIIASLALISAIGRGTDEKESFKNALALFWPTIWIMIVHFLALWGGFLAFIIPGIIFAVWFMFWNYALVLEGARGTGALLMSRAYVEGYWWAVLGRTIVLTLLIGLGMLIVYAPLAILLGATGASIIYGVMLLFIGPFSACYTYKMFENLKRLKPNAAEEAVKRSRTFIVVFAIIGILAIIAAIAFFGAFVAYIITSGALQRGSLNGMPFPTSTYYPSGYQYPSVTSSGPVNVPAY